MIVVPFRTVQDALPSASTSGETILCATGMQPPEKVPAGAAKTSAQPSPSSSPPVMPAIRFGTGTSSPFCFSLASAAGAANNASASMTRVKRRSWFIGTS